MLEVATIFIEEAVSKEKFRCDLEACHGACCCIPGWRGAPLADGELAKIDEALPFASRFLGRRNLEVLDSAGPYEGRPGDYATMCVDDKECVFVYFDERRIARCSFERAFESGLTTWRKPLSCHLFPIRVRNHGSDVLHYEQIPECQPGRDRGEAEGAQLFEFLREPLTRLLGESWYAAFHEACTNSQGPTSAKNE